METTHSNIAQIVTLTMSSVSARVMIAEATFQLRDFEIQLFEPISEANVGDFFKITFIKSPRKIAIEVSGEPKDLWQAIFNKRSTIFDDPEFINSAFFKNDESPA